MDMAEHEEAAGNHPLRVADIGEFGLIGRLRSRLGAARGGAGGAGVVLPNGDDCAGVLFTPGRWVLATSDMMVEGEHFLRAHATPRQIGRKALAINLSDIAAMGGDPKFALTSLAVPEDTPVECIEAVYDGLREEGEAFGTEVIGGNVARSPAGIILDVHLLGESDPERTLRRSGARPGDVVMVTGTLGDAAAGLRVLLDSEISAPGETADLPAGERSLVDALLGPKPRVPEGRAIANARAATAMIDLSDGLSGDLSHLCEASRAGAVLDAGSIPVSDALRAISAGWKRDPVDLALQGGEDYELLMAVRPEEADDLAARVLQETGTTLTAIGRFTEKGSGLKILREGREEPLEVTSYDHLRK